MNKFIYLGSEWAESHEKLYLLGDSILFLLFLLGVLYLFIFAFFSLKKRKDTYPKARKRYRFAVLFPAYDEDEVILHSVEDFLRQEYPRDKYDIIVISDHMSDETNERLRDLSAKVVKITEEKSTKTNALQKAIKYIEDKQEVYDEKIQGSRGFYNQRRRWLANQFSSLMSGITQLPIALLKGNWDYCDKLFQWAMPPRVILLGFIVLFSVFFTFFDWVLSIKWWFLLVLLGITFSIAVPDNLVDHRFRKALKHLPLLFILMFLNFFRLRGANKKFIHTKHSHIDKLPVKK